MKKFFLSLFLILVGIAAGFFARPFVESWLLDDKNSFSSTLHFQWTETKLMGLTEQEKQTILNGLTEQEFFSNDEFFSKFHSATDWIIFKSNNKIEYSDFSSNEFSSGYYEKIGNDIHLYDTALKDQYQGKILYVKTEQATKIVLKITTFDFDGNGKSWVEVTYTLQNQ